MQLVHLLNHGVIGIRTGNAAGFIIDDRLAVLFAHGQRQLRRVGHTLERRGIVVVRQHVYQIGAAFHIHRQPVAHGNGVHRIKPLDKLAEMPHEFPDFRVPAILDLLTGRLQNQRIAGRLVHDVPHNESGLVLHAFHNGLGEGLALRQEGFFEDRRVDTVAVEQDGHYRHALAVAHADVLAQRVHIARALVGKFLIGKPNAHAVDAQTLAVPQMPPQRRLVPFESVVHALKKGIVLQRFHVHPPPCQSSIQFSQFVRT